LGQERERERAERELRRLAREELMKTDPEAARRIPDEAPSCEIIVLFVAGKAVDSNDTEHRRHNDRGTTLCSTTSASLRHYRSGGNYLAFASIFLLPIC